MTLDEILTQLRERDDPLYHQAADLLERKSELERLRKIESAAKNLVAVKGRYHTEQAYKQLEESLK